MHGHSVLESDIGHVWELRISGWISPSGRSTYGWVGISLWVLRKSEFYRAASRYSGTLKYFYVTFPERFRVKPADFRPQLAKLPTKTSIRPPEAMASDEWDVERKWDGMRAVFHILPSEDTTLIFTRNGLSLVPQFPELQNLHTLFKSDCILDGEIVAIKPGTDDDEEDLELLQMRAGDKNAKRIDEIPVTVKFFDCIRTYVGEDETIFRGDQMPHSQRMEMLGELLDGTGYALPELLTSMPIP